jgi:hypothetical protein
MPEPIFVRMTEVCRTLGLDHQKVWGKIVSGKIKAHRQGNGPYLIRKDDIPKIARAFGVEVPAA